MPTVTVMGEFPQAALDVLLAWDKKIPTMYFLDICAISHIKDHLASGENLAAKKQQTIAALRNIDLFHNAISYLPAVMEKASDQNGVFSVQELIEEANRDTDAISNFFKNAKLFERRDFVHKYIRNLMGIHPEILGNSYHEFLKFANDSRIYNPVAPGRRLAATKELCDKADELGIIKMHPIVLTTLACIYDCRPAKKVINFKANPAEFNSSNAVGDILFLQRIGKFTQEIEDVRKCGGPFARAHFITADEHLEKLSSYFVVQGVQTELTEDGSTDHFAMSAKAIGLFPILYGEDEEFKDADHERELLKLYELIGCSMT